MLRFYCGYPSIISALISLPQAFLLSGSLLRFWLCVRPFLITIMTSNQNGSHFRPFQLNSRRVQTAALHMLPFSLDHVFPVQFYCSVLALPLSPFSASFSIAFLFRYAPASGLVIGVCPIFFPSRILSAYLIGYSQIVGHLSSTACLSQPCSASTEPDSSNELPSRPY